MARPNDLPPPPATIMMGAMMAKTTRWLIRYGVAVASIAVAVGLMLIPEIGRGFASVVFFAVLISAWYGGLGPGLLATALTALLALVLLVLPAPTVPPWRVVSIGLYLAGEVLITFLVEALHAARRRAEATERRL